MLLPSTCARRALAGTLFACVLRDRRFDIAQTRRILEAAAGIQALKVTRTSSTRWRGRLAASGRGLGRSYCRDAGRRDRSGRASCTFAVACRQSVRRRQTRIRSPVAGWTRARRWHCATATPARPGTRTCSSSCAGNARHAAVPGPGARRRHDQRRLRDGGVTRSAAWLRANRST